ncbi:S8 family serine peptidase [Rugamonas rubra]|nr:S8 family serine peptidase [Rugamonas rubra]
MDIEPAMDSRLQVALARQKSGSPRMALASTSAEEIAVIAKVDDVQAWEALSEVKVGVTLGAETGEGGVCIVTGRIPIKRIEAVRHQPFVQSLKASQPVRAALAATTRAMKVAPGLLPAGTSPEGGKGVVVGIVDFGCDFAHDNFRRNDGSTRIEAIWDQAGELSGAGDVQYGRLHTQADIDAALRTPDPYAALGYGSHLNVGAHEGAHGTHVMDIAAGNGLGSGTPGCAPQAAIIFVEVSASDIAWSGPTAVDQSFGDSVQMLEAVSFIFAQAGDRPCVVNLSLGTNGGPHDGTTLVEQGLDRLIRAKPNRAVVIAAANSQADHIHTEGTIPKGGSIDVRWKTENSPAGQEMEVWMAGTTRVAVEVIAPDGSSLGVAEPGSNMPIGTAQDIVVYVGNRLRDPNNLDNMIGIYIAGAVGGGQWTIRLFDRGNSGAAFHAWIERLDTAQSSFVDPIDSSTLGSISCGHDTICVGSYDAHKSALPMSYFSSTGPTRDGRFKPEVSAPGHAVRAARSGSRTGLVDMSGTSMAAPAVAGLVALVLAEAVQRKQSLSSAILRDILIKGAVLSPPDLDENRWHPGYGRGRASSATLSLLRAPMQGDTPPKRTGKTTTTPNPSRKRQPPKSNPKPPPA